MRYYVLAPTGERYGPADIPTLTQWAGDKRLFPSTKLMEEMSGTVVDASSVPGLIFPQAAPAAPAYGPIQPPAPGTPYQPTASATPYQPPMPGQAQYPRGYSPASGMAHDSGVKEMWMAFGTAILAPIVGLLLIYGIFIAIAGVQFAWRSYQKGQKWAILALVLNVLAVPIAFYMRFILRYQLLYGHGGY